jgi:hypothetical protein|tara:strand:- start:1647 stop:2201 length:555 start_codon:yes stop_codon:yes gene_type:complete
MKRHFYISDNLAELEIVEQELEESGFSTPQIHVLSDNDAELQGHNLHKVDSVLKKDLVRSGEIGFVVGAVGASIILLTVSFTGWADSSSWIPFLFLSVIVFGFCTWEGAFIGMQKPHHDFKRFREVLSKGEHIFIVDVNTQQESKLEQVIALHPQMQLAGMGVATPSWVVLMKNLWRRFINSTP